MRKISLATNNVTSSRIFWFLNRHPIIQKFYNSLVEYEIISSIESDLIMFYINYLVDDYVTVSDKIFNNILLESFRNSEFSRESLLLLCKYQKAIPDPATRRFMTSTNRFFINAIGLEIPRDRISKVLAPYWFILCISLWESTVFSP